MPVECGKFTRTIVILKLALASGETGGVRTLKVLQTIWQQKESQESVRKCQNGSWAANSINPTHLLYHKKASTNVIVCRGTSLTSAAAL